MHTVSLFIPAMMAALQQQGQAPQSGAFSLLFPLLLVMILVFMFFGPQRSRQKKWQQVLASLKNGDRVTTTGGIRGQIMSIKDDVVQLRIPPDNIKMEFVKTAIASVDVADSGEKK